MISLFQRGERGVELQSCDKTRAAEVCALADVTALVGGRRAGLEVDVPVTQIDCDGLVIEDETDIPVGVALCTQIGKHSGTVPFVADLRIDRDRETLYWGPR